MRRIILTPDLVVLAAGMVAAMHVGKLPPALPVLREALGLSLIQAGFLLSLVQLAGMSLGLLIGLAADNLGMRRSILCGLALLASVSALGGWAREASDLLWLRALEGCGFLLVALPAPGLIRRLVAPAQLNLRLGLWGCYMGSGTALALLCGPWVMASFGWQGWWWTLALLSLGMLLWVWRRVPADPPKAPAHAGADALAEWLGRLRLTLTARGPWLLALLFAAYASQWLTVIGFLPSIYAQAGIGTALAGALTALASAANVLGNLAAGLLLQRGLSARLLLGIGFLCMSLGTFGAFTPASAELPQLRYAAVLLFSAVGGLIPATLFAQAVRLAPSERSIATTVGWMQQWSALGQFCAPPLAGWLAVSVGGWHYTWLLTGGASLLGLLLVAQLPAARPARCSRPPACIPERRPCGTRG